MHLNWMDITGRNGDVTSGDEGRGGREGKLWCLELYGLKVLQGDEKLWTPWAIVWSLLWWVQMSRLTEWSRALRSITMSYAFC